MVHTSLRQSLWVNAQNDEAHCEKCCRKIVLVLSGRPYLPHELRCQHRERATTGLTMRVQSSLPFDVKRLMTAEGRRMTDMSEAYHEAGHAIAAHLNGRSIRRVSIVETDDAAGHVMRHSRGKKWLDALEEADHESCYGRFIDSRTRRAVEIEIMVSLAGGLTEMEALGLDKDDVSPGMELILYTALQRAALAARMDEVPEDLVHLAGDYVHVSILAEKVSDSLDEANAYIIWLEQRTRSLVRHPWFMPAAHALAQALAERKTLSGPEVRTIIDTAIEAAFPVPERVVGA